MSQTPTTTEQVTSTDATTVNDRVWEEALLVDPHQVADKAERVQNMFAAIAESYDLNNRLHSMWQDQVWRRRAVKLCQLRPTDRVLDVACGTGDLSLAFVNALAKQQSGASLDDGQVTGVDFTFEMLDVGRQKVKQLSSSAKQTAETMRWLTGDAMALPVNDQSVDVISIAFGIRNVAEPLAAIREFYRALRSEGRVCILEFSLPENPIMRGLYNFYFKQILPRTATWISRDRTGAYKYLPKSVNTFLSRQKMVDLMTAAGFEDIRVHPMTFGIAVAYIGTRR